jgi:O-antigen/teichoic acid export membrane protein
MREGSVRVIAIGRTILKSDAMSNGIGSIVRSVLRMLATILIARTMSVSGFGFYIALITIETLCTCIINALCTAAIPVMISGSRSRFSLLIISVAERAQIALTTALVMLGLPVLLIVDDPYHAPVCAFSFHMIALSWFNARRSACSARFRCRPLLLTEILVGLLPLVPLILVKSSGEFILSMYWAVSFFSLCTASFLLRERRVAWSSARTRRVVLAAVLSKGWKMTIGTLALTAQSRIQPLILGVILGSTGMGVYGAANMFGAPIRMLAMAVRSMALPRLSVRARTPTHAAPLSRNGVVIACMIMVAGVCCVPLAFVTESIVAITLGDGYEIPTIALPIVVWSGLLALISTYMVCEAQSISKIGLTSICRWLGAGVSLASIAPLTLAFGISGACLTLAIGELVTIASLAISMRRIIDDPSAATRNTPQVFVLGAFRCPTTPLVARSSEPTYL